MNDKINGGLRGIKLVFLKEYCQKILYRRHLITGACIMQALIHIHSLTTAYLHNKVVIVRKMLVKSIFNFNSLTTKYAYKQQQTHR